MSTEIEFVPDPSGVVNRPGVPWRHGEATPVSLDPSVLAALAYIPLTVDSIAEARLLTGLTDNRIVHVLGEITPLDGSGGLYVFSATSTAVDDGVSLTVIRPDYIDAADPGRLLKFS